MSKATDALYAEIGRRIYKARKDLDISQEELSSRVSLTRTSITNIEKGRQKLLVHTLIEIASALNIEAETLLPKIEDNFDIEDANQYLDKYSDYVRKFAEAAFKKKKE